MQVKNWDWFWLSIFLLPEQYKSSNANVDHRRKNLVETFSQIQPGQAPLKTTSTKQPKEEMR